MNKDTTKSRSEAKIGDFGLAVLPGEEHEVAGTQDYMAPEVKTHFNNGTKPETLDIVTLQKQDIYQLGLILYEMSHKIKTNMQKTMLFRDLGSKRKIADQCPLSKDDIEYKLIMAMTE